LTRLQSRLAFAGSPLEAAPGDRYAKPAEGDRSRGSGTGIQDAAAAAVAYEVARQRGLGMRYNLT